MSDRIFTSEKEQLAQNAFGLEGKMIAMNENTIDSMIADEKRRKLNNELEEYEDTLNKNQSAVEAIQSKFDITKLEIKPLYGRVLVEPFAVNPFQKVEVNNGIITDLGGMNPHIEQNQTTGKYEVQKSEIECGVVVETGPECRYCEVGDTVFWQRGSSRPIPFFKKGFWVIGENQILAVVNEELSKRF